MFNVLYYDSAKNTSENEEALKKITDWLNNQEGKKFRGEWIQGTLNTSQKGVEKKLREIDLSSPFTITEPKLENATLSFKKQNKPMVFSVKKLHLDLQKQELKIFHSDGDSDNYYVLYIDGGIQFNW